MGWFRSDFDIGKATVLGIFQHGPLSVGSPRTLQQLCGEEVQLVILIQETGVKPLCPLGLFSRPVSGMIFFQLLAYTRGGEEARVKFEDSCSLSIKSRFNLGIICFHTPHCITYQSVVNTIPATAAFHFATVSNAQPQWTT